MNARKKQNSQITFFLGTQHQDIDESRCIDDDDNADFIGVLK